MTADELLRRYPRATLRWLRGRLGLTQEALARRIAVAPQTVAGWEYGRRQITPAYRARLVPLLAAELATDAGHA